MDIRECIIEATADGAAPADPALATRYKRLVGALLYCATQTRPDVSYPVSMLCRAMPRPTTALMDAALRVLASLNKHKQVGLRYQHGTQRRLEGYSDADWAVQRSQSGFVFTLGRASISWGSKRQPLSPLSHCRPASPSSWLRPRQPKRQSTFGACTPSLPSKITRRPRTFISTTWAPSTPRTITHTIAA